jgi:transposase
LFLDEIAEWLAIYHDQPISTSVLHINLHDLGLTYKQLQRTVAEQDEVVCAAWCYDLTSHFTTKQLVFLDESSKDDQTLC